IINGKRYSHIIDPRTGNPVKDIVSVTIVADNATRADALSTGVFVLGLDKGMELIENLPDIEGIIIYERNNSDLKIKISSGLKGLLKDDIKEFQKVPESDAIMKGS
ncbi:MAG: FAD:protein FMN transferase, partial [Candidatus Scalindua sp.]